MKYFKDENNAVYAYEDDGSQDAFIKPDLVAITEEEADQLRGFVPSLADAKAAKKASIRAYRDNLLLLTSFNGKVFQTDLSSKLQITVVAGQSTMPESAAKWRTADNSYADMSLQLFQELEAAIMAREGAAFTNSSTHQDAVDALTDVDAVQAYDFSIGWPD